MGARAAQAPSRYPPPGPGDSLHQALAPLSWHITVPSVSNSMVLTLNFGWLFNACQVPLIELLLFECADMNNPPSHMKLTGYLSIFFLWFILIIIADWKSNYRSSTPNLQ
jgi:hypothetical protein